MFLKILSRNKKILAVIFLLFISIFVISPDLAGAANYRPLVAIPGVNANAGLMDYLNGIYTFLISIVGILAMAVLVYGGLRYVTSAGNTASIGDAKESINAALVGLILALTSWLIFSTINQDILVLKPVGVGLLGKYTAGATNICAIGSGSGATASPCECLDGKKVYSSDGAPGDCKVICSDKTKANDNNYHCIKADLQIGKGIFTQCGFVNGKGIDSIKACDTISWDPSGSKSKNKIVKYEVIFNDNTGACNYSFTVPTCGGRQIGGGPSDFILCSITPGENKIKLRITDNAVPPNISEDITRFTVHGPPAVICL